VSIQGETIQRFNISENEIKVQVSVLQLFYFGQIKDVKAVKRLPRLPCAYYGGAYLKNNLEVWFSVTSY
jgi:hypothetical protein